MNSIEELIKSRTPQEPHQLQAIKKYVMTHHGEEIKCTITQRGYSITVANASLASTLQMETPKIIETCQLDKKLFIRIGHF